MSTTEGDWQLLVHADARIRCDPQGPLYGEFAQGLGLASLAAVISGAQWNALVDDSISTYQVRIEMGRAWGITTHAEWFDEVTALIGGRALIDVEAVLAARTDAGLDANVGVADSDHAWRQWLIDRDYDESVYEKTRRLVELVHRAEATLRPEFLDSHDIASTGRGFALSWAVRLAVWGVQSGYGDRDEATQMILAARANAAERFRSWRDFAVSALLGTMIFSDIDWPVVRGAAATLLTASHSPWVALAFPGPDDKDGE